MKTIFLSAIALSTALYTTESQATEWEHLDSATCELSSNAITSIEKNDSGIWIGTEDGLSHFDGDSWTQFNTDNSALPSNAINNVHVDAQGGVWVATYDGLAYYSHRTWLVFTTENSGLPSDLIRSVTSDQDGNIWIGTWGHGLVRKDGTFWTTYNVANSDLPSNGIFTVEVDAMDRIWVGTSLGGAAVLEHDYWTVFNTQNSQMPNDHVRSIAFGADQSVWLGTDNGLARLFADGEVVWEVYTSIYFGHGVSIFRDAEADAAGNCWFATDAGLLRFDGNTFNFFHTENAPISANNSAAVTIDDRGNVFVGHTQQGISIYNPDGVALPVEETKWSRSDIEIFPTPATDGLTVKIPPKGDMNFDLVVTDFSGRTVLQLDGMSSSSGEMHQQTVDVSSLPSGTYIMTVRTGQGVSSGLFLKM